VVDETTYLDENDAYQVFFAANVHSGWHIGCLNIEAKEA
jgi:hypothetical protein